MGRMLRALSLKKKIFVGAAIFGLIAAVVLALSFTLSGKGEDDNSDCQYCKTVTTQLGQICSHSEHGFYKSYAISTDSNVCANTGKQIIEKGGNAVDSIISVLLCMGVTIPESLGLGGGSFMVLYNSTTKKGSFIDAREVAPMAARPELFDPIYNSSFEKDSFLGLKAIAVPGELAGYWHAFNQYGSGKIKWEQLFEESINFAKNGFTVGEHLNDALEQNRKVITEKKNLKSVYFNPETKDLYKMGEIMKQPVLAQTLTNLSKAKDPLDYYYNTIAGKIMDDLNNNEDYPHQSPLITLDDFKQFKINETEAHAVLLKDNITLHTVQLPGSGAILSFILKTMLESTDLIPGARNDIKKAELFYHRLMETFKFAFSRRMYLGDDKFDNCTDVIGNLTSQEFIDYVSKKIDDSQTYPSKSGFYDAENFQSFDHGTAHVSVLDKDGNAVSVTSTVNLYFGSKVMSPSTGIILNDQMDDFNTGKPNEFELPSSSMNKIAPGKRPLSSMTPSIFVDDKGVRLAIGASGGPKIITAMALASLRHLWLGDDIKMAIDSPRLHHQLFPVNVENEECFIDNVLGSLKQRKHEVIQLKKGVRGAIVMGISRSRDGLIEANSDYRKGGTVAGE